MALDPDDDVRVAVVGGGAVGLAAATSLADRDVTVTLYERDQLGSGATGRAAGLCYDAYADRMDARIAARSLARFRDLGVLTECPYVWVAREGDDHVVSAIREQVDLMQARGRDVTLLNPHEIAERFPTLQTDHLQEGAVATNAGYVDPDAFLSVLTDRATTAGVHIETETPVGLADTTTVATPDGFRMFDAVLLAAGPHTCSLVADVGCSLALGTYSARALVTERTPVSPPLFYDASEQFYLRPDSQGILVGDGVERYDGDPDDFDPDGNTAFLENSIDRVETALDVSPSIRRDWAGLCTATPDRNPLLGACRPNLFVATGWHGHGFMRAPAFGQQIADQMLGGDGIDHFDPTRFAGDEEIALPDGIVD